MKPRTTAETAIYCVTGLIALALVFYGLHKAGASGNSMAAVVVALSLAAGMIGWPRYLSYLTARKRAESELTGSEQYHRLADEYRRLADLAITAQEHTDLKLGDVSAQLDHLREQIASLQKILKEVE